MNKIIIALTTLVITINISACGGSSPEEKKEKTCQDGILAYQYAKDFIKNRLKAPSTAEFPSFRGVSHTYKGKCSHRITGAVDAQNSFGAKIRNRFDVTVRYNKEKETYSLESLSLK
ncbi:hypothetical protein GCM10009123_03020 [Kangiella japonica]|uniref:Lipoprotein n=1 Tax=Kangiella japonica TaxID=647384 RepID=A0ABP3CDC3_9GAMM